jgi:hypothetical protein
VTGTADRPTCEGHQHPCRRGQRLDLRGKVQAQVRRSPSARISQRIGGADTCEAQSGRRKPTASRSVAGAFSRPLSSASAPFTRPNLPAAHAVTLGAAIGEVADYLAVVLLGGVGLSMLFERDDEEHLERLRGRHGLGLLALGLSVRAGSNAVKPRPGFVPDTLVGRVTPANRGHGASRTRTGDLLGAIQALSQLSYSPAAAQCTSGDPRSDSGGSGC